MTATVDSTMHALLAETRQALENRQQRCRAAQRALTNNPEFKGLRVGVLLSGGGWRAMLSSTGFLDGLCEAGVFDSVSLVSGLSGGAWAVTQLALSGPNANPFHALDKADRTVRNPWWYGQSDAVATVPYDGLQAMLSHERCSSILKALNHTSWLDRSVDFLLRTFLDGHSDQSFYRILFPHILFCNGRRRLIPKYSNFLGQQVMQLEGPTETQLVDSITDARHATSNGDIPVCSIAMIAESSEGRDDQWVEVNPFVAWNLNTKVGGDTGTLTAAFEQQPTVWYKLYAHHLMGIAGSAFNVYWDDVIRSFGIELKKGSWFENRNIIAGQMHVYAEPLSSAAKEGPNTPAANSDASVFLDALPGTQFMDTASDVICSITRFGMEKFTAPAPSTTRVHLGELRDAGLSACNVPFPMAMCRDFDVLLVLDSSAGATNAYSLFSAITMFETPLVAAIEEPVAELKKPFGDAAVRTFHIRDGPTVLYALGLTGPATSVIVRPKEDVLRDVQRCRRIGVEVGELLKQELLKHSSRSSDGGWLSSIGKFVFAGTSKI